MLSHILKKALYIGLGALLLAACHSTTEEKKEPVKEKRFMYNDYNDVQIPAAEKFGISPIENRDTNFAAIPKLELVESDDLLVIEPLTHSVPYLKSLLSCSMSSCFGAPPKLSQSPQSSSVTS